MDKYCRVVMLVIRVVIVEGIVKKSDSQRIVWQKSKAVWSNLRKKCGKSSPVTVIVGGIALCLHTEKQGPKMQFLLYPASKASKEVANFIK